MPEPDDIYTTRQRVPFGAITSDGFIEYDDLPPIDLIGNEWDFKFGEAEWDKFLILMVKSSNTSPNAECSDECTDGLIMKSVRKSDDCLCDLYICKRCDSISMALQPDTVLLKYHNGTGWMLNENENDSTTVEEEI